MADPRPWPWQHVSEPATPVERVCAACGYQMGQAICTHCGEPTETDGRRLAREWFLGWRPNLTDLARRIDEDRAALAEKVARAELRLKDADRVADEVAVLVVDRVIDSRSAAADALLDYRNPPRSPRADRLAALEAERDALACATHRACQYEPGDCCVIGSVIGAWDAQWTEVAQERDRLAGERDALRAALLATRDHKEPDGPCWCWRRVWESERAQRPHGDLCLQARAALGGAQASRRHPSCASADAPLGCEDCSPPSIRGLDPDFTTEPTP